MAARTDVVETGHRRPTPPIRIVHQNPRPQKAVAPRRLLPNQVLGVLVFLGAELMLFAGLISALLILRANADAWPPPGQPRLPVLLTALNTVVLLASAVPMWLASRAAVARHGSDLRKWLIRTAALGSLFLMIQGSEWVRLVQYGLNVRSGAYGGTFYALIGCHGLHVVGGVLTLWSVMRRASSGRYTGGDPAGVHAAGLYWAFVVGIWPLLYVLVYLT